jgi:hypothetical protein
VHHMLRARTCTPTMTGGVNECSLSGASPATPAELIASERRMSSSSEPEERMSARAICARNAWYSSFSLNASSLRTARNWRRGHCLAPSLQSCL